MPNLDSRPRRLTFRSIASAVALLTYLVSTIGVLPGVDNGQLQGFNCRCSHSSETNGGSCCQQRGGACPKCALRSVPVAKRSCCSQRTVASNSSHQKQGSCCGTKKQQEQNNNHSFLDACNCAGDPAPGMISGDQPRLLPPYSSVPRLLDWCTADAWGDCFFSGRSIAPEIPPPRALTV